MPSSGYNTHTFSAGEVPTTTIWNYLWTNDASFNNGLGFNDNIILTRHMANKAIGAAQVQNTYSEVAISGNGTGVGPNALTGSITMSLAAGTWVVKVMAYGAVYNNGSSNQSYVNIYKNGSLVKAANSMFTKAADQHYPWCQIYITTAVNGDVFRPYSIADNGAIFHGLADSGLLTVEVIGLT